MKKYYCVICKENVVSDDNICPKCNTDYTQLFESLNECDKEILSDNVEEISDNDFKETADFFIECGTRIKVIAVSLSVLIMCFTLITFISSISSDNEVDVSLCFISFLLSIFITVAGCITEHLFRWKAYMLHINKGK